MRLLFTAVPYPLACIPRAALSRKRPVRPFPGKGGGRLTEKKSAPEHRSGALIIFVQGSAYLLSGVCHTQSLTSGMSSPTSAI